MYRSSTKNIHKIWSTSPQNTHLYLGDYYAATNVLLLRQLNISAVLTTAASLNINHSQNYITHKIINAWDIPSYNLARHFYDAYEWIDEQLKDKNVLVHCAAGISRSATIVVMYLIRKNGWDLKTTLGYVREKRSVVCPNFGFVKQLERFERVLCLERMKEEERQRDNQKEGVKRKEFGIESKQNTTRSKHNQTKKCQNENIKDSSRIRISSGRSQRKPEFSYSTQKIHNKFQIRKSSSIPKRTALPAWKQFLKSNPPLIPTTYGFS